MVETRAVKRKHSNGKIGSFKLQADDKLKIAPKFGSIFCSGFSPSTTSENVIDFVKKTFPEVLCEEVQSRYPKSYNNFKVSVYVSNLEAILSEEFWPEGIYFNKFFYRRKSLPGKN